MNIGKKKSEINLCDINYAEIQVHMMAHLQYECCQDSWKWLKKYLVIIC